MASDQQLLESEISAAVGGGAALTESVTSHFPAESRSYSLPALLLLTVRRWWLLCGVASLVLSVLLFGLAWWLFEPQYIAEAWIRISANQDYIAYEDDERAGRGVDPFVETQLELIQSPVVLERVVSRDDIAKIPELLQTEDRVRWLQRRLRVEQLGTSELFRVALPATNAKHSAQIVQAIVDAYLQVDNDRKNKESADILELLGREETLRQRSLELLRSELRTLAGADSSLAAARQNQIAKQSSLAFMQSQLKDSQLETAVLQRRLEEKRAQVESGEVSLPMGAVDQILGKMEAYAAAQAEVASMEQAYQRSSELSRSGSNPFLSNMMRKIDEKKKAVESVATTLRPKIEEDLRRAELARLAAELQAIESELKDRELRDLLRQQQVEDLATSMTGPETETLEAEFKRQDLEREAQILQRILDRTERVKTESRAPSRVEVLRDPTPPVRPEEFVPLKSFAAAGLISMVLPISLAFLWERTTCRIASSTNLEEVQLPLLGQLPALPLEPVRATPSAMDRYELHQNQFRECVHYLRTNLQLAEIKRQAQVLAVVSAVSGECKSSVAVQLASSLAATTGGRVLLVDGDTRSPDIHDMLGLSQTPGLVEVLGGDARLDEAIVEHGPLWVLPAGQFDERVHELITEERLESLFEELKEQFAYVVVDTPPLLAVGDGLVFAVAATASLLCTRYDYSRRREVAEAVRRLKYSGANTIGAVMSGMSRRRSTRYGDMKSYYQPSSEFEHDEPYDEDAFAADGEEVES